MRWGSVLVFAGDLWLAVKFFEAGRSVLCVFYLLVTLWVGAGAVAWTDD